ncbi:MAG: ribonuclease HII [Fusobacteriaceae bacterium]
MNELYEFDKKYGEIIGVDEAGRGPLAGPVVAACAFLKKYSEKLDSINDSKKLTEKKREELVSVIEEHFHIGVGLSSEQEIDDLNILNANFLAMRRSLEKLDIDFSGKKVLVDGNIKIRGYEGEQDFLVKGDSKSLAIAAASIIAKTTRDKIMCDLAKEYPEYKFEKHKGYGTALHRKILLDIGASPVHRKTFLRNIFQETADES